MGRKGLKSLRNQGEIWDEVKQQQVLILMTPTGKRLLDELIRSHGLSRSEFFERIARGEIRCTDEKAS